MQRETFPQFKVNEFANFPLPKKRKQKATEITSLAKQILSVKAKNPNANITDLEREIDRLVYALYGLTPDEIRLVEEPAPSSGSRAEPAPVSPPVA